ncbi:hypothetical protein LINPERHAP2_LOCUS19789 [Linum perenne]
MPSSHTLFRRRTLNSTAPYPAPSPAPYQVPSPADLSLSLLGPKACRRMNFVHESSPHSHRTIFSSLLLHLLRLSFLPFPSLFCLPPSLLADLLNLIIGFVPFFDLILQGSVADAESSCLNTL